MTEIKISNNYLEKEVRQHDNLVLKRTPPSMSRKKQLPYNGKYETKNEDHESLKRKCQNCQTP